MKLEHLRDLYILQLRDLLSAELQIKNTLPKLLAAATSEDLRQALEDHAEVTQCQAERLGDILKRHGVHGAGEKCAGMEGMLREAAHALQYEGDDALRDLAIIAACKKVELYEVAGYGHARTLAERLGEETDALLLSETLEEESAADDELTSIAIILLSQVEVEQAV